MSDIRAETEQSDSQTWQIRLRLWLLIPGTHRWNAWVRDLTAWLERPYRPRRRSVAYPHLEGDFLIIGPECFTYADDPSVISWRGENYVPQGSTALGRAIDTPSPSKENT